ncbi:MAG TPA: amidohydrolase [Oscillospiraceae bacterium]|nr:amidohydrolase [Oscillospiraceae bacterium]
MRETLRRHRRALHQIPELGHDLPETAAYVRGALEKLPCTVFSPVPNAVCAFFDAGKKDAVAFRADMDALPIAEKSACSFASRHPGRMHACGHDGHMAMLLGLAERIPALLEMLPNNVLLIFQPAEETDGGARLICETGLLERYHVLRVFGLHLWPGLPAGKLFTRPDALMAKSSEVDVEIAGKSAHISRAGEGADALYAGAAFLCRVYEFSRRLASEGTPHLLKFGLLESGTVRNALSAHTVLRGSLRVFSPEGFSALRGGMREIADGLERETGCVFTVSLSEGYPAVVNDPALWTHVRAVLGADAPRELPEPVTAGEDFSFYQQRVPGLFAFLGVGPGEPLHSAAFAFDEDVLQSGLDYYEKLLRME